MTTKLEQAARQALEFFESGDFVYPTDLATTLREALEHSGEADEMVAMNLNCKSVQARLATLWGYVKAEQAEQEPVAWRCVIPRRTWTMGVNWGREYFENEEDTHGLQGVEPLYAAPVRTKDLTDYFINELHKDAQDPISFARAVIAADREKNK